MYKTNVVYGFVRLRYLVFDIKGGKEEHRMMVFEKSMLRKIKDEVIGGC
jgi:hypothetical protein